MMSFRLFSKPRNKAVLPRHRGRAVVLNLDILRHILSFVETHKDLLAAMLTCHALYDAGIQPLVRLPVTITIWPDDDTLPAFHDFMLSHSPATFLAFRELYIDYGQFSTQHIDLITDLLNRGTKLRHLTLPCAVIDANEGIGEAVVSLRELEELTIEDEHHHAIDRILTRLHSPLAKIDICFDDRWADEDDAKDPALLLANFRTTLERAKITSAPFFTVDVCYPKLLDLELHLSGAPSLSVLATAFPNLQTLLIRTDPRVEELELTDIRNQSIAFQADRKCWESLKSVNANCEALYAMGLKHTLQSVTITPIEDLTAIHLLFLRAVLSTTKAEVMSFHLPDTPGILSEVLSDVGSPLVSLELTLKIHPGVDHKKTLDELLEGLSSVTAVMFQLTLHSFMADAEAEKPYPARDFLHSLNERTLVYRIGAYMRNVACIYLNVEGQRASYWINTASGSEKKEWTRAQLDKVAVGGGLTKFLSHIISTSSVST